jgi:FkbM family methyltransferase
VSIASLIRRTIPDRWQLPARYYHQRATKLLEPELDLLVRSIRPGDCVVDAGANFGVFSYAFVRRGAIVHAFEPQPLCIRLLESYARSHPNLRVYPYALGPSRARATLSLPADSAFAGSPSATLRNDMRATARLDVDVIPLDDLHLEDVDLIKIDVEGTELRVLEGAGETISRCRPLMMIEIEQRHHSQPIETVFAQILARGYRAECLDGGRLVPVSGSPDELRRLGSGGVYNFLFAPTTGERAWNT